MASRILVLLLILATQAARAQSHPASAGVDPRVFDTHVHLHQGQASLDRYWAQAAEAGVELSGVAAMWFGGPNQARAGDPAAIAAGNDGVIALARHDRRVLPVATVHPEDGQAALDELARVAAAGVRVLKLHPHTQRFDLADARVLPLVHRAGELGMVVLLDNAGIVPDDHQALFDLALRAPRTQFIFAHIGGMEFRFWNVLALARTAENLLADNLHFDISGTLLLASGSPLEAEFVWTLRNVGIERVLLGSDYPQLGLGRTVQALERLPLSEEEKAMIRSGNARRLFGR